MFSTDHFGGKYGGYRPVVALSFALNHAVAGLAPLTYHLLNVILHAAVTVLVYRGIKMRFGRTFLAAGTAILFAVHPVHTEAVAWVSGRADLLAALFFLSAWVLYMRASSSMPVRLAPFVGSLLAFALALLSKEHTLLFPVILVLSDLFCERNRWPEGQRAGLLSLLSRRWWLYLSYCVLIGLYLAARYLLFGRALLYESSGTLNLLNPLLSVPWYPRVLTAARVLLLDLGLLVWPAGLSNDYSYNQIPLSSSLVEPEAALAVAVLLALFAGAWMLAWRGSVEGFGLLFYFTLVAATANVLTVTHTIRAERLLYLPSLGIFLTAAALVERIAHGLRIARRWIAMSVLATGVAAVCLMFAVRSVARNQDWKDHHTLWRSAAQIAPASAVARYGFGLSLAERGQMENAIAEYRQAILIYPAYRQARMALGLALVRIGQGEEGIRLLREVVAEKPDIAEGYVWLGEGLVKMGMLDQAVSAYQQALTVQPNNAIAHYLLGSAFLRQGEVEKAVSSYLNAVALWPETSIFFTSLGYAYLKQEHREEARAAIQHALRLTPNFPQALAVLRMLDEPAPTSGPERSDR